MICGKGMSSDAGGRPEVKGMTGQPPAVCSRVWPRRREKNDDRQLTNGMMERAADASKKNGVGDGWAGQGHELAD